MHARRPFTNAGLNFIRISQYVIDPIGEDSHLNPVLGWAVVTAMGILNVLVVEDDADIRLMVGGFFRDNGCVVREAEHGQDALDVLLIERWRPNVILLDIRMPVMDGMTFLAKKREAGALSAIPVIIVSGTARAPVDGACCVLPKPVDPDDLLRAVEKHAH